MKMSVRLGWIGVMSFGLVACTFAQQAIPTVKLSVSSKVRYVYDCSYRTIWNRENGPADSMVSRSGSLAVKVDGLKNGVYGFKTSLSGWRTVAETYREGNDLIAKSRESDRVLSGRVNVAGQILSKYKADDWRSAMSVFLPLPGKSVKLGDRWTAVLPVAPGTYSSNRKVVYEVFDRQKFGKRDVLSIQFTSEPTIGMSEVISGDLLLDIRTGMIVRSNMKNLFEAGGQRVRVDVKMQIRQ